MLNIFDWTKVIAFFKGSKVYRFGSSVPRTIAPGLSFPSFPYTLKSDEESVSVVQKNGLVTRMIKLVKVRGFSSVDNVEIDIHVKSTQNSFWRFSLH